MAGPVDLSYGYCTGTRIVRDRQQPSGSDIASFGPGERAAADWDRLCTLMEMGTGAGALASMEATLRSIVEELTAAPAARGGSLLDPPDLLRLATLDLLEALDATLSPTSSAATFRAEYDELEDEVGAELGAPGKLLLRCVLAEAGDHYALPAVDGAADPVAAAGLDRSAVLERGALAYWMPTSGLEAKEAVVLAAQLRALLRIVADERYPAPYLP